MNLTTKPGRTLSRQRLEFFRKRRSMGATSSPRRLRASRSSVQPVRCVMGGPIRRNATSSSRLPGTASTIGATTLDVPTLLQRDGIFTEPFPDVCRRSTVRRPTTPESGGFTRSPFPGNAIRPDRIDPVARTLLERYPRPTAAARPTTSPGCRQRCDQDQFNARIDLGFSASQDAVFAA